MLNFSFLTLSIKAILKPSLASLFERIEPAGPELMIIKSNVVLFYTIFYIIF